MKAALPPVLAFLIWALGNHYVTPPRTRNHPNAGTPAPTATATRPRRYVGRHAANRKRDTA